MKQKIHVTKESLYFSFSCWDLISWWKIKSLLPPTPLPHTFFFVPPNQNANNSPRSLFLQLFLFYRWDTFNTNSYIRWILRHLASVSPPFSYNKYRLDFTFIHNHPPFAFNLVSGALSFYSAQQLSEDSWAV